MQNVKARTAGTANARRQNFDIILKISLNNQSTAMGEDARERKGYLLVRYPMDGCSATFPCLCNSKVIIFLCATRLAALPYVHKSLISARHEPELHLVRQHHP